MRYQRAILIPRYIFEVPKALMRSVVMVLLLSSLLFAQDMTQQAAQDLSAQAQEMMRQSNQDVQAAMDAAQQASLQAGRDMPSGLDIPLPSVTNKPRYSPKPGKFKGVTPQVTITDSTKGAVIYFTTDGSKPTLKSQRYTGPITISTTTTLKAIAVAPSSKPSPVVWGKYTIK